MTHNTLHTRNHLRSLESESRTKFIRRRIAALATVVALGAGIAHAKSGSHESDQPLWQQMDTSIERELQKGPSGADAIVHEGSAVTIDTAGTVQDVIAREYPELSDSVLQNKANNASALEAKPETGFLQQTDEVVVWQDAELEQQFGQVAILAAPVDR